MAAAIAVSPRGSGRCDLTDQVPDESARAPNARAASASNAQATGPGTGRRADYSFIENVPPPSARLCRGGVVRMATIAARVELAHVGDHGGRIFLLDLQCRDQRILGLDLKGRPFSGRLDADQVTRSHGVAPCQPMAHRDRRLRPI